MTLYGTAYGDRTRLWLSVDAGATWAEVALPAVPQGYTTIGTFQPVGPQPGVIYAHVSNVTRDSNGNLQVRDLAVVRSSDGGSSWNVIGADLAGNVHFVVSAPSDPMTAYVGAADGYYRTGDAGRTWERISGYVQWSALQVDERDASLIYLGVTRVSEDGGAHWRESPAPSASYYWGYVIPDPVDRGRAFTVSQRGDVFETRDAARSWTRHTVGVNDSYVADPRIAVVDSRRAVLALSGAAELGSSIGGTVVSLDLSRPRPIALGTDLWLNPAQPGWGLSITQHDNLQLFAVWLTYDGAGKARWFFIPGGEWTDSKRFRGTVYSARYAERDFFSTAFDPSLVTRTPVGEAMLTFDDASSGRADFAMLDGARIIQPIQRFAFGPAESFRQPVADVWWNALESGWGITLHQQYGSIFATWYLYDERGEPTWLIMPNAKFVTEYRIDGDLYRATSNASAPYVASRVVNERIGAADLRTSSRPQWAFHATMDGRSISRQISTLPF